MMKMAEGKSVWKWLNDIVKLPQYYNVLIEDGLDDLEIVKDLTQDDLIKIGVDKYGHQKKIVNVLIK